MAFKTEYMEDGKTMFKVQSDWVEIRSPELFNFDTIGDTLEGILCEMKNEPIHDEKAKATRMVMTCKLRHADGKQTKFRPQYDLREKLGRQMLGKRILIVFHGENNATQAKGNSMKMFRVFVAPDASVEPAPFVPTDDDVPDFEDRPF